MGYFRMMVRFHVSANAAQITEIRSGRQRGVAAKGYHDSPLWVRGGTRVLLSTNYPNAVRSGQLRGFGAHPCLLGFILGGRGARRGTLDVTKLGLKRLQPDPYKPSEYQSAVGTSATTTLGRANLGRLRRSGTVVPSCRVAVTFCLCGGGFWKNGNPPPPAMMGFGAFC